jgi:hypothetical protein
MESMDRVEFVQGFADANGNQVTRPSSDSLLESRRRSATW